jgi:enoyl-[acyl-carrier-protein] reductase (NADH)
MARNPDNYNSLVEEINKNGGKAMGISADVSSEESMKSAFDKIKAEHKDASCAAAIFNASGRFARQPLLEMKVDDFQAGWEVSV